MMSIESLIGDADLSTDKGFEQICAKIASLNVSHRFNSIWLTATFGSMYFNVKILL